MTLAAEQANTGCVVVDLRACTPHPPEPHNTHREDFFFPSAFFDFSSDDFGECFPLESTFSITPSNVDLPLSPPASAFCTEPTTKDTSSVVAPGAFDFSDLLCEEQQPSTPAPVWGVFSPPLSATLKEEKVDTENDPNVDLIDINEFLSTFTPPESPCTPVKTEQDESQSDTTTAPPTVSSPPPLTTSDTETAGVKSENGTEFPPDTWETLSDTTSEFIDPRLLFSPSPPLSVFHQHPPTQFLASSTLFLPTCISGNVGDVNQQGEEEDELEVDVETIDGAPGVTGSDILRMYVSVADPTPNIMVHAPVVAPPHPGLMPLPHYMHVNQFFPPPVVLAEAQAPMTSASLKAASKSVTGQNSDSASPGPYTRRTGKFSKEHRRETHNLLEKKRRDEMKIALDNLANCVPKVIEAQTGSGKIALMQVLDWSTEHMRWLRQANFHINAQKQALLDSNGMLLARLKELQSQSA